MLEIQGHGVWVDVPQVPEADLAFGHAEWGLEKELHRDGLVVRHPQVIHQQISDGGGVCDDQVERVALGVCGDINMLCQIEAVQK